MLAALELIILLLHKMVSRSTYEGHPEMAIEWAMSQLPAAANQKRKKGNERRKSVRKKRSTKNPPLAKRAGGWASQNVKLKSERRGAGLYSAKSPFQ